MRVSIVLLEMVFLMIYMSSCTPRQKSLRIMSYNIRIGVGMDITTNLERPAEIIKRINPDYVGLQEVDSVTERTGWIDQAKELGRLTGMYPIFAPAIERSKGLYGIAALVKEKPIAIRNIQLPGEEELRTFLMLEYNDYILCNTHFSLRSNSRKKAIVMIENIIKNCNKPIILTGDFNMRPLSEECQLMGENWVLLSDSTVKTFPSDCPRVTLDYIWGCKGYEYHVTRAEVIKDSIASDHLPLFIDVLFK